MDDWKLGAAESLLLQKGPRTSGAEVLKMALTELVAGGRLRLEGEPRPRMRRRRAQVGHVRPSLQAVLDLFDRTVRGADGLEVARLAAAVREQYGSLDGYRDRVVLAGMLDEGLFVREQHRVLWVFPATRYVLTFAGQTAKQRLDDLQRQIEVSPAAALPAAGAAVLLMPEMFPELREEAERARRAGSGADGVAGAVVALPSTEGEASDPGGAPAPGLDPSPTPTPVATLDVPTFDFGSLDFGSLDAAIGSIDAGVSDGGSSADGGGGGGGDGGSSGN
jgi:hypothetical protein